MRWIVNYIRQCFCKHDFEVIMNVDIYETEMSTVPRYIKKVYRCKKCGYVQKIKI